MSDSIFTGALINDEHTLRDFGAAITNSDVISMPDHQQRCDQHA